MFKLMYLIIMIALLCNIAHFIRCFSYLNKYSRIATYDKRNEFFFSLFENGYLKVIFKINCNNNPNT